MKVLVTGQVGLDKLDYLEEVRKLGAANSKEIITRTTGKKMVDASEGKVDEKTILNLPKEYLDILRRLVWQDILGEAKNISEEQIYIVNSHSIFRWHHGMFPAIDLDLIQSFSPDIVVTMIDNIHHIKQRLVARNTDFFELWEILAWREEEIWVTRLLAESLQKLNSSDNPRSYIIPRKQGPELLYRVLTEPSLPKVYISFPITNLAKERKKEVQAFKEEIQKKFIAFDPFSVSERGIVTLADSLSGEMSEAFQPIRDSILKLNEELKKEDLRWRTSWSEKVALGLSDINIGDGSILNGGEIASILEAIDSQIISRDFLLIDQADFVLMYIHTESGVPRISAGCQSEMVYGYSRGKPVYVVCDCGRKGLSPWVTQFSEVFETVEEAISFLGDKYCV